MKMNQLISNGLSKAILSEANTVSYCNKEQKPCIWWVSKYFKDCLCNLRDDFSFGFGLISLIAWGVAEIPQIITNFQTKSSHGVSIVFLLTWVFGDIFNLLGCLLEPATLPTQYYTALLYTTSTLVLLFQSLYYDHFYWWWRKRKQALTRATQQDEDDENKKPLNPKDDAEDGRGGMPIPANAQRTSSRQRPLSARRESYYFTSARSLAGSSTPPFRSYLRVAKSGPSAVAIGYDEHWSSEDENEADTTSSVPVTTRAAKHMPIPRSAARGVLVAASVNLPLQSNAMAAIYTGLGRRLLQEEYEHSVLGQWLGWMMAAIYMGGRFPQIILNIKRGSVEGLNPLMFIFALVANVTYVASILVRSTEWKRIKANMPWLLDAVVCVVLDLFIILQYVYYKHMRKASSDEVEDQKGNYFEAESKA